VKDGLMFVTAGRYIYALNAKTGEQVWKYATTRPQLKDGAPSPALPNAAPNERGVGIGDGLVFVGLQDGNLIALTQKSGDLVWVQQTGFDPPKQGQVAAVAPTYFNGIVFTGLGNGDTQLRGRLTALNARTGQVLWRFYSIPGPEEPGHDTWPSFNETWSVGGGGVWTNAAVDPELGIVYFTTGNPVPASAGDWRPGSNLYTCSVIALDISTGKMKWYYQLVHHDVFDADAGTPVVLYDAPIAGTIRKALAVVRADGYLFQLDRETGEPLLSVIERPVPQLRSQRTFSTQPFPVHGESLLMSCKDWKKEKIPSGFILGCMWTPPSSPPPSSDPPNVLAPVPTVRVSPMAYSPRTGYFYVQGLSTLAWFRRSHDPYFFPAFGNVPGLKQFGEVAAIDRRSGKIAWKKRTPGGYPAGGAMVTAGGLVFRSSSDGNFEAHDAGNGNVLWTFQMGWGGARGSPVSFAVDGEQYIAVPAGTSIWAFKLGGGIVPLEPPDLLESNDFSGPLVDTGAIETTSLRYGNQSPGVRYFVDEYMFNPYRARVRAGTDVLFVNNGSMRHEFVGVDRSWSTGPLSPAQDARVKFDKPGEYTYICREHPWSYGQITVWTDPVDGKARPYPSLTVEQAMRGQDEFKRSCQSCHGEDLGGRAVAPALSGNSFLARWRSARLGELYDRIRTTMPQASPGSLDRQTYVDIVVYILQANGIEHGQSEITDKSEWLREVIIGEIR
jgi:alcohol dehydrogenase (cytochrome c)